MAALIPIFQDVRSCVYYMTKMFSRNAPRRRRRQEDGERRSRRSRDLPGDVRAALRRAAGGDVYVDAAWPSSANWQLQLCGYK